jgi:hypothetical protein
LILARLLLKIISADHSLRVYDGIEFDPYQM